MVTTRPRGPLRALHNTTDLCIPSPTKQEGLSEKYGCETTSGLDLNFEPEEFSSTPLQRNSSYHRTMKKSSSFYGTTAAPRATSYRAGKYVNTSSVEDIRHHFPIRSTSKNNDTEEKPTCTRYLETEANVQVVGLKRSGNLAEEEISQKQARYSSYSSTSLSSAMVDLKPIQMTMGSYVKAHPRYYRRRSGTDALKSSGSIDTMSAQSVPAVCTRLSPMCSVPMPEGFPSRLPGYCAAVSLPWEFENSPTRRTFHRTMETQTSPKLLKDADLDSTADKKHTRTRFNLGSSQVLVGLRKTLGQLRRAVSAERLQRIGQTPPQSRFKPAFLSAVDDCVEQSEKCSHPQKKRSSLSKKLGPCSNRTRRISTGSLQNLESVERQPPVAIKQSVSTHEDPVHPPTIGDDEDKLTCRVISKYPDGSWQVVFRRSSVFQQFGFFIARDSQGIYISRMGSVRCAAKFWDIFHVGDRILEVQGVQCAQLTAEDVQNLIRGCELAYFRIKPARVGSAHGQPDQQN